MRLALRLSNCALRLQCAAHHGLHVEPRWRPVCVRGWLRLEPGLGGCFRDSAPALYSAHAARGHRASSRHSLPFPDEDSGCLAGAAQSMQVDTRLRVFGGRGCQCVSGVLLTFSSTVVLLSLSHPIFKTATTSSDSKVELEILIFRQNRLGALYTGTGS